MTSGSVREEAASGCGTLCQSVTRSEALSVCAGKSFMNNLVEVCIIVYSQRKNVLTVTADWDLLTIG